MVLRRHSGATVDILLGNSPATDWPANLNSARISMTRTLGAAGCGTAASTLSKCWCRTAAAGCDFVGDPTAPLGSVTSLCSGDWTLDTAVTAAFTANACQAGTAITTTETSTPAILNLPYGGTAPVNVIFQANSAANINVQFDG